MENQKYSITKSKVELYKLRHPSGMYWADITIDHNGTAGRIQIASDYGDWQNYWSHCGKPFKQFLIGLDMEYAAGKFGCKDYFDAAYNINELKKHVIELRRENCINSVEARNVYNEIKEIEDECTDEAQHFYALVNNTTHLFHLYYDGFDVRKTYQPGFKAFWKKVWPEFLSCLKRETEELATDD